MRTKSWFCCILLLLLPLTAGAETPNDASLRVLFAKSGTEKQLEMLPIVMKENLSRSAQTSDTVQKMPPGVAQVIIESMPGAFEVAKMKEAALFGLRENLTDGDVKELLDWFDSPLGKRVARLEEEASSPEAALAAQKYVSEIQNSPSIDSRLAILKKLDVAARISENSAEMLFNAHVAIAYATVSALLPDRRPSIGDVRKLLEEGRANIETIARSTSLTFLLYTYRSLSDQEIQKLLTFALTPVGSKFASAQMGAFKRAIMESCFRWGNSIGEALKHLPVQKGA